MKNQILSLINEQTSPLFRIMSIYNQDEPARRRFENNISAFHIGNGFVLTVAHNLRVEAQLIKSLNEESFQESIITLCNENETELLNRCFIIDPIRNKRYMNITDQNDIQPVIEALKRINYDTRWITLYERNICKPFLIVQFVDNLFYNDHDLTIMFDDLSNFPETSIGANTFIIELELIKAFYSEDFALYKIINTEQEIINKIPVANISYDTYVTNKSLYCLQSSPSGTNLGRLLNESRIEGLLDHHAIVKDRIGGNFIRNGLRYLLKGYFRFGSSGAPYFVFDEESTSFKLNAIQSEASPIQLSINNDMKGNFQYINAIASPISIIRDEFTELINS